MAKQSINIRPGVGILGLFPNMNYKAWYAMGEFVDNALDSYLSNVERLREVEGDDFRLRVVIDVEAEDGGSIRVWDNAGGIATKDYERAFVTAEPPPDSAGLSQFGIGMKSAACWFAREWRVRSKALGETVERTVEFDVPRITRDNIESLNASSRAAEESLHFTEVRLWNLYKPPQTQTVGKMRRHLSSMYRQFLRRGDVIIEFRGEPLEYNEPATLVAPHFKDLKGEPVLWRKQIDTKLSSGERVEGFVGIREKGSTKEAGLALFRHHRLIVGSDDETYRPTEIFGGSNSFTYQRLYGELELDDFDVSHTKDGFLWEDKEAEFLKVLRRELESNPLPMLQQADGYRARRAPADLSSAASKAASTTATAIPKAQEVIESQVSETPARRQPPKSYGREVVATSKTLELTIRGERWKVAIETTTDPAATDWVKVRQHKRGSKAREIGILLSISHPFTQRFGGATADDVEGLVRIGVGLAIAETTAREAGVDMAGVVVRNLNELLSGVLANA